MKVPLIIGHSNRSWNEFTTLLSMTCAAIVADVSVSRKLIQIQIDPGDTITSGWRNKSFQAHTDHMRTQTFENVLTRYRYLKA